MKMVKNMKILENLGIELTDEELLTTALTHTSYSHEHNTPHYERLEYLGDAVLELVISDYLYNNTDLPEGLMSKTRSEYVCENALYEYAKELHLEEKIRVGNGIDEPNKTVIADVFEAVIGVIYLENGLEKVKDLFNAIILPHITNKTKFLIDYKSMLQELVQMDKKTLVYKLIGESGPAHNKSFEIEVSVDGIVFGRGKGHSKKEAEQMAARDAYNKQAR